LRGLAERGVRLVPVAAAVEDDRTGQDEGGRRDRRRGDQSGPGRDQLDGSPVALDRALVGLVDAFRPPPPAGVVVEQIDGCGAAEAPVVGVYAHVMTLLPMGR
jgi:hypothetical protein